MSGSTGPNKLAAGQRVIWHENGYTADAKLIQPHGDYHWKIETVTGIHWVPASALTAQALPASPPWREFKVGNEFLPYHPQASHVEPSYRDGWNACYQAAQAALATKVTP